jgi:hypothetical protein
VKENEIGGHVARMGEMRSVYKILIGKSEGKRILRRPRHRWEDNIIMDLRGNRVESYRVDASGLG